jgi:hypothetical protein
MGPPPADLPPHQRPRAVDAPPDTRQVWGAAGQLQGRAWLAQIGPLPTGGTGRRRVIGHAEQEPPTLRQRPAVTSWRHRGPEA